MDDLDTATRMTKSIRSTGNSSPSQQRSQIKKEVCGNIFNQLADNGHEAVEKPGFVEELQAHFNRLPTRYFLAASVLSIGKCSFSLYLPACLEDFATIWQLQKVHLLYQHWTFLKIKGVAEHGVPRIISLNCLQLVHSHLPAKLDAGLQNINRWSFDQAGCRMCRCPMILTNFLVFQLDFARPAIAILCDHRKFKVPCQIWQNVLL